jgi:hypothetical protein
VLAAAPILSTDVHRYVWDARVQAAAINPYRYIPADPALFFVWLALPAVGAPSRALLWLATMPLLLIDEPIPGDRFFWPSLVYVPATLLLLAELRPRLAIKLRRRPEWETPHVHYDCPEGPAPIL